MAYTLFEHIGMVSSGLFLLFMANCIWKVLYVFVIGPMVNRVNFKSYGKWALITGSTDGIGKEYARQLAAHGCDIVLVSRSTDKLKATAQEIEKEFKVQTRIIQMDFSGGDEIYTNLTKEVQDLEIGVLVNNVGVCYEYPEYFLEVPERLLLDLVKVNVLGTMRVTSIVMPGMVKRRKGIVINIGSGSSTVTSPMLTVYAATKAFIVKFSEGLRGEYKNDGIIVQCLTPSFILTKLSKMEDTNIFVPTTKTYVESALSLVGTAKLSTGYFFHSLIRFTFNTVRNISEDLLIWIAITVMEKNRKKMKPTNINS